MLDCIRHRGPDDEGQFASANVSLGMVRLSIIDILGGHQPIFNEDHSICAVFNGEIYNYLELREELINKGHSFRTNSDTEVIVHSYEEYGVAAPHKFNGMFAIAIWDQRKDTLYLFRDRFGEKPLFYAHKSGKLVFGSEIKALLHHPAVSRDIDNEALAHYFSLRNIPAPFTVYKDVRALLPASMLTWNSSGIGVSMWYRCPMETKWNQRDEVLLIDRIDELLKESVRLRLRSEVAYGAYLSGGIDSSMVVGIMSRYAAQAVKTFTITYADTPAHKADARYARMVADLYSTEHHEYVMRWEDLQKDLPYIIGHLDQPFAGVIASFWLSRFMSQYVTVALSGDGADDLFASYGHHRLVDPVALARKKARQKVAMNDEDFSFFSDRKDFVLEMARYCPWEWRLSYAAFMETEKSILFSEKGRDIFSQYSTADFLKGIYNQTDAAVDDLNKMLYLDINTLLPNEILYFNDMLSMANAMEVRTPFLDYRIVELACSIPGSLKIRDMQLKYILRKVAARYVPKEILERPKEGFVLPKNTWLREGMASLLKETLSKERLDIHGYFNQKYVDSLIGKFLGGDDAITFKVWTMMVFQLWYEENVKGNLKTTYVKREG
jgi:asparagine synthase (glutamine-hydrolysing)